MRTSVLAGGAVGHAERPQLPVVVRNWLVRRRLKKLLAVDERLLDDMGLTRAEIYWALALPLSVNPAVELQRRSELRRSRSFALKVNRGRRAPPVAVAAE